MERYRADTAALSNELLDTIQSAWRTFIREKLAKGLPESKRPTEGREEEIWSSLAELIIDQNWKQECIRRDEKFDMHFSSAVGSMRLTLSIELTYFQRRAFSAIETAKTLLDSGTTGQERAHQLIDESTDVLVLYLDDRVCLPASSSNLSSLRLVQIYSHRSIHFAFIGSLLGRQILRGHDPFKRPSTGHPYPGHRVRA